MHLNLGGIVKGIVTGLETFAETGNPAIAAGAGALACVTDGGNATQTSSASSSPLLEELRAENASERSNVNALSSFAQQHTDFGSLVDPDLVAA